MLKAVSDIPHLACRLHLCLCFPLKAGTLFVLTLLPKPLAQGPSSRRGWSSGPAAALALALTSALRLQVLGDEPGAET